jgi:hypothetical protein
MFAEVTAEVSAIRRIPNRMASERKKEEPLFQEFARTLLTPCIESNYMHLRAHSVVKIG